MSREQREKNKNIMRIVGLSRVISRSRNHLDLSRFKSRISRNNRKNVLSVATYHGQARIQNSLCAHTHPSQVIQLFTRFTYIKPNKRKLLSKSMR